MARPLWSTEAGLLVLALAILLREGGVFKYVPCRLQLDSSSIPHHLPPHHADKNNSF
jgi:hypothetical protein